MTWKGLFSWIAGAPILAQQLIDYVNSNLAYLLNPAMFFVSETSGSYTTTSASLVLVHANYSKTLTTYGGHFLAGVTFRVGTNDVTNGIIELVIDVDGTPYRVYYGVGYGTTMTVQVLIKDLPAGTHTFSVKFRNNGTHTTTISKDNIPFNFWGIEL